LKIEGGVLRVRRGTDDAHIPEVWSYKGSVPFQFIINLLRRVKPCEVVLEVW